MELKIGRKKTLLILFSFLIVGISLISFLIVPMIKKIYQQKDFLEEAKLILKRDQENIDKYKEDLEYIKKNHFLNEGLVINEDNRVKLIEDLEKIAFDEKLNLEIEMHSSGVIRRTAEESSEVHKTFLKLSLSGQYEDFLAFLYKLQNFKYAINIDKLIVENFDDSKIKNIKDDLLLENLPEIEGEIVISFK